MSSVNFIDSINQNSAESYPKNTEPIESLPTNSTRSINSPKHKFNFHSFLIFILITIGFGCLGYWGYQKYFLLENDINETVPILVPTTGPQNNWKTYVNDTYRFSFEYPPDYTVRENCSLHALGTYLVCLESPDFSYLINEPGPNPEEKEVIQIKKGSGLFISKPRDYEFGINQLKKDYENQYETIEVTSLNYIPAIKKLYNNEPDSIYWELLHNNQIYKVWSPWNNEGNTTLAQVLSSFKFFNKNYKEVFVDCSERKKYPELDAVSNYLMGASCEQYKTQQECEAVDIIALIENKISEDIHKDNIPDCVWNENSEILYAKCSNKYVCRPESD